MINFVTIGKQASELLRLSTQGLLPNHCLLCGAGGLSARLLCPDCQGDLRANAHSCALCGIPLVSDAEICGRCLTNPPPFDAARIPLLYIAPCDFLIKAFKFDGKLDHGKALVEVVTSYFAEGEQPKLLIPVPLHRARQRQRGFNQSEIIARDLGRQLDIPFNARLCRRNRDTWTQTGLNAGQRKRNLRGAFEIKGNGYADHVAIVDDVVTTGSTLVELAHLLKVHGVERVDCWALARTPARNDP